MRRLLANTFHRLGNWLQPKAVPQALTGQQWSGTQYVDAYKRNRQPTPNELMAELKNTAWVCISLNSAVCANNPPQLYVLTDTGDARAKCKTKALSAKAEDKLRRARRLPPRITKAATIEQVIEHPLNALLAHLDTHARLHRRATGNRAVVS
jgi:hypothetical protein